MPWEVVTSATTGKMAIVDGTESEIISERTAYRLNITGSIGHPSGLSRLYRIYINNKGSQELKVSVIACQVTQFAGGYNYSAKTDIFGRFEVTWDPRTNGYTDVYSEISLSMNNTGTLSTIVEYDDIKYFITISKKKITSILNMNSQEFFK